MLKKIKISLSLIFVLAMFLCVLSGCDNAEQTEQVETTYTVTYNYDGDIIRNGVLLTSKTEVITSSLTLPIAVKEGYNFVCWQLDGEDFTKFLNYNNKNIELTPKFSSITKKVGSITIKKYREDDCSGEDYTISNVESGYIIRSVNFTSTKQLLGFVLDKGSGKSLAQIECDYIIDLDANIYPVIKFSENGETIILYAVYGALWI